MSSVLHRPLLKHVQTLLTDQKEADANTLTDPSLFLLEDEGEHFWELLGIRPQGSDATLLGAIRFRKQPSLSNPYARRPLSFYFSRPPRDVGAGGGSMRPRELVEMLLPRVNEDVEEFRSRVQTKGEARNSLFIDAELIEFAFDFRRENPSVERERAHPSMRPEPHLFRTARGHVIAGVSHGLHVRLHRDASFLTIHRAVQFAPTTRYQLPTLIIHRSFLIMEAVLPAIDDASTWVRTVVPFHPQTANATHLLLPD